MNAKVEGLNQIPVKDQPSVTIAHFSFQIMVILGTVLVVLSAIYLFGVIFRRHWRENRRLLWLFVVATPMGFLAVEAGWVLTEAGRQPWIIQGVMRVSQAVTPMPGIQYSFILFTFVYLLLTVMVIFLLFRQIRSLIQPAIVATDCPGRAVSSYSK
jgi:cytochrome d ubiquinol oxidase subunit I